MSVGTSASDHYSAPVLEARRKHLRPTKPQCYSLHLDCVDNSLYIQATPLEGVCYTFKRTEDTRFNLSAWLREPAASKFGLSEFDPSCTVYSIPKAPGDRKLCVEVPNSSTPRWVNLDQHLGVYETYNKDTGELKAKFGIRPKFTKRSIILCFDGTSNQFSNQNTNVVSLMELLKKDDPEQQMVYYQPGVGTYGAKSPGLVSRLGQKASSLLDQAVARYLYEHIIDGYTYLMETYRAGDQISIFGFSRGAYTARALAGMLHSVGLLPRHNTEQVSFAYEIYAASVGILPPDDPQSLRTSADQLNPQEFRRAFCTPVEVTFLGVWDTVGSVGAVARQTLPWIEYNPSVKNFRQALALDENRGNFIPSTWNHSKNTRRQNSQEVWFKGGHCDIGGGALPTPKESEQDHLSTEGGRSRKDPRLSNISLRWMVRQCLAIQEARVLFNPVAMDCYRAQNILEKRLSKEWAEGKVLIHKPIDEKDLEKQIADLDDYDINAKPDIALDDSWVWWLLDNLRVPKLSQMESGTPERSLWAQALWRVVQIMPGSSAGPQAQKEKSWRQWIEDKLSPAPLGEGASSRPNTVWSANQGAPRIINFQASTNHIQIHSSVYRQLRGQVSRGEEPYIPAAKWYKLPQGEWPLIVDGTLGCREMGDGESRESTEVRKLLTDNDIWNWTPGPDAKSAPKPDSKSKRGLLGDIFGKKQD